jgi:hypothetical protein
MIEGEIYCLNTVLPDRCQTTLETSEAKGPRSGPRAETKSDIATRPGRTVCAGPFWR